MASKELTDQWYDEIDNISPEYYDVLLSSWSEEIVRDRAMESVRHDELTVKIWRMGFVAQRRGLTEIASRCRTYVDILNRKPTYKVPIEGEGGGSRLWSYVRKRIKELRRM